MIRYYIFEAWKFALVVVASSADYRAGVKVLQLTCNI
uniref:Uncharacterized protein n=1 Tax=Medicago truncatula TaxID=3880 RepID=A2Q2I0_MEDTR|nr:hypothetical protein MtrDRAFT_AC150800g25v2 [Medicago truncatula]